MFPRAEVSSSTLCSQCAGNGPNNYKICCQPVRAKSECIRFIKYVELTTKTHILNMCMVFSDIRGYFILFCVIAKNRKSG